MSKPKFKNQYVNAREENRTIIIDYNKILGRDDLEDKSTYVINRRSFYKILDFIADDIDYIIKHNEKLSLTLLSIRLNIYSETEKYNKKMFYDDLLEIVNDESIKETISEFVESSYTLNLDDVKKKNVIKELQLTDEVNKIYLKSAMMMRLLLPVLCDYKMHGKNDTIFLNIFKDCIRSFNDGKENALNKLYKIIFSRIFQTKYSDKVMWRFLKNISLDPHLFTTKVFKSIIKIILPKLEHNTSSISYLDVVIRRKLNFEFTFNHPISYKSIRANNTNDDLDDKDKLEINSSLLRSDEGLLVLNNCSIKREIRLIVKKYNISEEDVETFRKEVGLNTIQEKLLNIYYSNKFEIVCNDTNRIYLILGMIKGLEEQGFRLLPVLLESRLDEFERRVNSRKKLIEKVVSSNKYKKLLKDYVNISNILAKNNSILSLITIKNNKFIHKGEEVNIEMEILSDEILDLLILI